MKPFIQDLTKAERDIFGNYGGKSRPKYGVIIDGERWMVKFPKSPKSSLSEYIGSQIYASLGIPVHETTLGFRNGQIAVICKDFDLNHELIDFGKIKNSLAELEDILITGSKPNSSHGEFLHNALTAIDHSELLKRMPGIKEHFWDMFVVDGFIHNNNRSNDNWGIMVRRDDSLDIAPVYGNSDSFTGNTSYFLSEDGWHIHPFEYSQSMQNPDCTAALIRFSERLDMNHVRSIIEEIPEKAFHLTVITPEQKGRYIQILENTIEQNLNPTLERLDRPHIKL